MSRGNRAAFWPLLASAAVGAALAAGSLGLYQAVSGQRSDAGFGSLIPMVQADVGRGEYLFLPCRKEIWVVNKVNGKFIHYQLKDNELGTTEASQVAEIDQLLFPLRDTDFMVTERNLTSFLWVMNRATGEFQYWRRGMRDNTVYTDALTVPAGAHLRGEPMQANTARKPSVPPSYRRPPAAAPDDRAAPKGKRLEQTAPAGAKKDS